MKKTLPVFLVLAALIACFNAVPAHALPTVNLNVLDNDITVGEFFDVQVIADGGGIGEDLLGFGFDVLSIGNFFSYEGYVVESGFFDVSDQLNPINVSGGFSSVSDDDALLATLSFKALATGSDYLGVMGAYDGLFYGLFYESSGSGSGINTITNITINPQGTTSVPEPSTMLVLCIGLIGMAGLRKFKTNDFRDKFIG